MSARWSDAPQDRWLSTGLSEPRPFLSSAPPFAWTDDDRAKPTAGYDGLTMPAEGQGQLLRGILYAVAFQAAALALLALLVLIIVLAEHAL